MSTPVPAPPTPHRRERRKDARPGELMDAALTLFVDKGFAATRVEEVASLAGVSKGTLFLYFPSKVELFKAVVRENIAGRFGEWNSEFDSFEGTTVELVRYAMHQWWERIGATRASGITKLVMSEAGQFPEIAEFYTHEVIEPGNALIRRILQRGIDRGEFRPLDLDYAIFSVIAPLIFAVLWKHSLAPCCALSSTGRNLDPKTFIDQQAEMLLQGLMRPASTSAPQAPPTHRPAGR